MTITVYKVLLLAAREGIVERVIDPNHNRDRCPFHKYPIAPSTTTKQSQSTFLPSRQKNDPHLLLCFADIPYF